MKSPRIFILLALSTATIASFAVTPSFIARQPQHAHSKRQHLKELIVEVSINQQRVTNAAIILQNKYGQLLVSHQDLQHWRLQEPPLLPILYKGKRYYLLQQIVGLTHQLDISSLQLRLEAAPMLFIKKDYRIKQAKLKPQRPTEVGGYLNYDLNLPPYQNQLNVNGLFSLGLFGPKGVVDNEFIINMSLFNPMIAKDQRTFIRLNNTYTLDFPEKMMSYRLGDSITQNGMWGHAVAFGGLQVSTNFATQPRFITYPLPTIAGEAVLPSTVDLFINNAALYHQEVMPGAFDIQALPVINGAGEVSLVTRDMLGRQRVITLPYYTSSTLLKPGLVDYSFEAGFIRRNIGINSFDYGKFAASGTYRKGINNQLTEEVHGSLTKDVQALGVGLTYLLKTYGVIDIAVAGSHNQQGFGALAKLALERSSNTLNVGLSAQLTSNHFMQLGQSSLFPPAKRRLSMFIGMPLQKRSSVGVSLVSEAYHHQSSTNLISANYTLASPKLWTMTLSGLTNIGGSRAQSVFLTITKKVGQQNTVTVNSNQQNGLRQFGGQFNHNSGARNGIDYYVSALPGQEGNLQGGVNYTNQYGDYSAQVAHQNKQTTYTANASGSIAYMAGQWRFTQRVTNSFGVVQIPGYEGVGVYMDNQLVAHTNNQGYAFIPDLRSYDSNKISFDPTAIPIDAHVSKSILHAVPYYHSGVLLKFDINHHRDGLLTIVLDNGRPIPAGAMVQINQQTELFPVGYQGEVYLAGFKKHNTITATWHTKRCQFTLDYPNINQPQPQLGQFQCRIIK